MMRSRYSMSNTELVCPLQGLIAKGTPTVLGVLIISAFAGCGSGTCPVQGKVVYPDGTPVTTGLVVFESVDLTPTVSASGKIQPDGSFRLGTFGLDDGTLPGKYRATVVPPPRKNPVSKFDPAVPEVVHPRFRSFETSGLEFEVARGNNLFELNVKRH